MSTENENWRDASGTERNEGADRDGNQYNGAGFGNSSYNRENREQRPYRPRFNASENGGRPQKAYSSDRPYRPRFNAEGGERPQRSYGNSYRPRFNNNGEEGERPQRAYGNNDRPYRPRFNAEGGERPQRPRFNPNAERGNGYTPRPYGERPQRPRFNPNAAGEYGNGAQRSYGNNEGERPQRPRFNPNGGRGNNHGGGNAYGRPQRPRTADYNPNAKYSKKKQMIYKELNVDPNEPIRLNKYLANSGVCSRREADEFIQAGVVSVNDVIVTELGTKVKRSDIVKFHDQLVSPERKVYILLNKPKDCVTTSDDPQERHTVLDLVQGACDERVYPVGRLDRNTTGVLLLTNDGELASKLTHPKFLKKKIYYVKLDKPFEEADMQKLAEGITLEDGEIKADDISYVSEEEKDKVGIEIHSGKNRIVRRMFESLGYHVKQLDRVFFAGLTKKGLRRGEWRFLTQREVNMLQMGAFE